MPSTINADNGVVSGSSGVKTTADTSGELALQSNGVTGLTLNTTLALGVGSGNSTGTTGQVLTSAGSGAAPIWSTPAAVNLATGVTGTLPVANGGTGATSLTANNVLLGNGTSAVQVVAPGTTGNVLTSNGTTWTSVAPAAGGTVTATASGSITAGNSVIVNSNGTVSVPTITLSTSVAAQQTVTTVGYQIERMSMLFHPLLNVYVVIWTENISNNLMGQVGAPASDGSITWSSATILWLASGNQAIEPNLVYYESQQRMVGVFGINTSLAAIALTVTTTGVSAAASAVSSGSGMGAGYSRAAYDPVADCVVTSYRDQSSAQGTVRVMKLAGTTITWPTAPVSLGAAWYEANVFYFPPAGRCVVLARTSANQFGGYLITVSGSTPSIGTQQILSTTYQGPGESPGIAYSPTAARSVVAFYDSSSFAGMAYGVLTISGSTLTLNNITVNTSSAYSQFAAINYDTKTDRFVWFGRNNSNFMQVQVGTLSGTTISWGTPTVVSSQAGQSSNEWSAAYDSLNLRNGVVYFNFATMFSNTVDTGSSSLTTNNFLGISNSTVANGASATIAIVGGVNTNQSGLTPATKYYVAPSGSLTTTVNSVYAGLALSATTILVKG